MEELEKLREQIMKEANNRVDAMADGSCRDYADYKQKCGIILALHQVKEWIDERVLAIRKGTEPAEGEYVAFHGTVREPDMGD